jgi:hypothetical protein
LDSAICDNVVVCRNRRSFHKNPLERVGTFTGARPRLIRGKHLSEIAPSMMFSLPRPFIPSALCQYCLFSVHSTILTFIFFCVHSSVSTHCHFFHALSIPSDSLLPYFVFLQLISYFFLYSRPLTVPAQIFEYIIHRSFFSALYASPHSTYPDI